MKIKILLEACEDGKYTNISEAECSLSIDRNEKSWSSDILLWNIFRHLCQIVSSGMKNARVMENENDRKPREND